MIHISAQTNEIADPGDLTTLFPDALDMVWLRRGDGMVASGELLRAEFDTITEAAAWWADLAASIEHESAFPGVAGVGPLALGSFVFDPANSAYRSVMVVPRVIVGRRDGRCWQTVVAEDRDFPEVDLSARTTPAAPSGALTWADGALTGDQWQSVVGQAVSRMRAGELDKVVLARDVTVRAEEPIDPRWLVTRLAERYERCWTYAVDGLVGASPEMLVKREGGLVTSRVLAGTIPRTGDADEALGGALSRSSKDLGEHRYAVKSVAAALAPHCTGMNVPDAPFVLELPNVFHLATDVTAVTGDEVSSLALAGALHPSAAVCGTPTPVARQVIAEIEGMDRERYAGPIGWVDLAGDGEWAIALRCGRVSGEGVRLFAGCGIVPDSDPVAELAESNAKLVPMRQALEG